MTNPLTHLTVLILNFLTIYTAQIPPSQGLQAPMVPISCESDSFHCVSDELCIPRSWQCDGDKDCVDGTDEENCFNHTKTESICDHNTEFHCSKSTASRYGDSPMAILTKLSHSPRALECIPKNYACDGHIDCENGEDEENCAELTCSSGSFKCPQTPTDKATCVPNAWRCDGSQDCIDGSDEKNCLTTSNCLESQFKCETGSQCIYKKWVCDGENDCNDGSDEKNCTITCDTSTHFQCKDGSRCLPHHLKCDGDADCTDHSDEHDCSIFKPSHSKDCGVDEFKCGGNTRCISLTWRCDGDVDCADGSDEKGCDEKICSVNQKKCDNVCKEKELWCNGVVDCNDGEDEAHCNYPHANVTTCDRTTQYKCSNDSKTCINYEDLCRTDSATFNCLVSVCNKEIHSCEKGSPNCKCRDTKYGGSICYCNKGYELDNNNRCIDINECKIDGICDQICLNSPGTYKCDCYHGFQLVPVDNMTTIPHKCRASGSDPLILVTNRASIRQYDMTKHVVSPLISSLKSAVAMDYWHKNGIVTWSDLVNEHIMSCQMDDKTPIYNISKCTGGNGTILVKNVTNADGLAVDWVHGLLFWTDSIRKHISVVDIKTGKHKILFNTSLDEPRAIAVDPASGVIFWTDWGKHAKIERAGMDGNHRTVIASGEHIKWPNGLTLDVLDKKIYFADAKVKSISTCDYWGNNMRTVIHSHDKLKHPFSLAVFEEKLYWSDWDRDGIVSANKFNGDDVTEVLRHVSSPMTVRIFHEAVQPDHPDKCQSHRCPDLCLPRAHYRTNIEEQKVIFSELPYSCVCNEGSILVNEICVLDYAVSELVHSTGRSSTSAAAGLIFVFLGAALLVMYVMHNRRKRTSNQFMRFSNPVYRTTIEDGSHDMDEITDRAIVSITRNAPSSTNSLIDNSNTQTHVNPALHFTNPTFGEVRD
uniref:Very low-density lipoprotein receptor n=1 Tax=Parastrongyloides trichosuri TaxID=131310 RepID=A0A0N4ZC09_PARTI